MSRLPRSLDAALRRIAQSEGTTMADLERTWLTSMVDLYDAPQPNTPLDPLWSTNLVVVDSDAATDEAVWPVSQLPVPDAAGQRVTAAELAADATLG